MGDYDFFLGLGHATFVPRWQIVIAGRRLMQLFGDIAGRSKSQHKALQQRVAGHTVSAVQTGKAGLADGIDPRHIGMAVFVDYDTAAGVVRGGYDGNAVPRDVDAEL